MQKKIIYILLALIIPLTLGSTVVHAGDFEAPIIPKPKFLPGPEKEQIEETDGGARSIFTEVLLPKYAINFISFMGATAVLMLLIGGIRFATFYGNEEGIEKAKSQIIYSLVGLALSMLAYAIVTIIIRFDYEARQDPQPTVTESD